MPSSRGALRICAEVSIDEFAMAKPCNDCLVMSWKDPAKRADFELVAREVKLADKYRGHGICKDPMISVVVCKHQDNIILSEEEQVLGNRLRGCWKLRKHTEEISSASERLHKYIAELPSLDQQSEALLQTLISTGRLQARYWHADFDQADAIIYTLDVGQADERIRVFCNDIQLNEDEMQEIFVSELHELVGHLQPAASSGLHLPRTCDSKLVP